MTRGRVAVTEVLRHLGAEAAELKGAEERMQMARTQFELSTRRFAAVREMASEYLGSWPYAKGASSHWPPGHAFKGREFRFVHMATGEAVIAVLSEAEKPLTVPEIMQRLADGHGYVPDGLSVRSITAAVTRLGHVEQLPGDQFRLKPLDDEDLPSLDDEEEEDPSA